MELILLVSLCVNILAVLTVNAAVKLPYQCIDDDSVVNYKLPELPYTYEALEPYIDSATLEVHHAGHHAGYAKKLNAVLKEWRDEAPYDIFASDSILKILHNLDEVPSQYRARIQNFGGGYVNHNLYFSIMSPPADDKTRLPVGDVASFIKKDFGSFNRFKEAFTNQAKKLFGSGYVWLNLQLFSSAEDDDDDVGDDIRLLLTTSNNQNAPMTQDLFPILILDVWEHAYYLKHQNKRADYIEDWWKVVDWHAVEELSNWWRKKVIPHDEL